MKKIITITVMALLLFSVNANAQSWQEIWAAKKEEAKRKLKEKADQTSSAGIDSAMNKPQNIIKQKIKKKGNKTKVKTEVDDQSSANSGSSTGSGSDSGSDNNSGSSGNSMSGEGVQTVIQTNILCDAGKSKIEKALKKLDGVFEVKVNIKNGELAIRYSSDGTSYSELLELINKEGFVAEGNKPAAGAPANPCKK